MLHQSSAKARPTKNDKGKTGDSHQLPNSLHTNGAHKRGTQTGDHKRGTTNGGPQTGDHKRGTTNGGPQTGDHKRGTTNGGQSPITQFPAHSAEMGRA